MLNKNLIGTLSLLLATPCFSGFYVGAGIGPEAARFHQESRVVRLGTFDVIDKENFSGIGVFGTLFGGYSWIHNLFYLAGEVNANMSSVQYKLTNSEYIHRTFTKTTFTVKNSEGISLLPGVFISNTTVFYGRVGYTNGRVKLHESDPTIRSATKDLSGIRYGLGLRHNITDQWTVMMDYSQINYGKISSVVFEPFGGVLKGANIYPTTGQVVFGVMYNFDRPKAFVK